MRKLLNQQGPLKSNALFPSCIRLKIPELTTAINAINSIINNIINIKLYLLVFCTILSTKFVTNKDPKKLHRKKVAI
jgi:hypothetical protein